MTVRALRSLALVATLLALSPPAAVGQERVVGRVLADAEGQAVEGAMVTLMRADRGVARALTGADGSFLLTAPGPGPYRLRVDRIGYASVTSEEFEVAVGATHRHDVVTAAEPITLRGLEVSGASRCGPPRPDGSAVARVWGEARKALEAAAWTSERELYRLAWIRYLRDLDQDGERVLSERRVRRQRYTPRPFRAVDAGELARFGYVREEGREMVYAAPDAEILLSDAFLDGHCLSVARGSDRGDSATVGLRFRPVASSRLPDVEGTLWLDEASGRLLSVEYRYVNLDRPAPLDGEEASGRLRFQQLPDGTWIIDEWRIRMPRLAEHRDEFGWPVRYEAVGYVDEGAVVTQIATDTGDVLSGVTSGVLGLVRDSLGDPLPGATLWLDGSTLVARSDASGRFTFEELTPGTWTLRATHPDLEPFGYEGVAVEVDVEEGRLRPLELGLPSVRDVLTDLCVARSTAGGPGTEAPPGILAGHTFTADGAPAPEVGVRATWRAGGRQEGLATTADERGAFTFCGVPVGAPIVVAVGDDPGEEGGPVVRVEIPEEAPVATVELDAGDEVSTAERPATATPGEPPSADPAIARWLDGVGFGLREAQARVHLTERELRPWDSIPQALRADGGLTVRRLAAGVPDIRLAAEGGAGRCSVDAFYLNGKRVVRQPGVAADPGRARRDLTRTVSMPLPHSVSAIVDRYAPTEVSGLEAFDGAAAPVGSEDACGAVLFWVASERRRDDPVFRGGLAGEVTGLDRTDGAPHVEVVLEEEDRVLFADEEGRFDFGLLPPARYRVHVRVPGAGTWIYPVTVRAYADTELTVEIVGRGERP